MSDARRCRPLAETWREFNAKFTSPNYYGYSRNTTNSSQRSGVANHRIRISVKTRKMVASTNSFLIGFIIISWKGKMGL